MHLDEKLAMYRKALGNSEESNNDRSTNNEDLIMAKSQGTTKLDCNLDPNREKISSQHVIDAWGSDYSDE